MKRNLLLILAAIVLVGALTGCSLARESAGGSTNDRLVGVLITAEYLDLFDIDAFLDEHPEQLIKGGEISVNAVTSDANRLYAEVEKDEEDISFTSISFPGVEGTYILNPYVTGTDGEKYRSSYAVDGIADVKIAINVTDDGEETSIDGTVYMTPEAGSEDMCFYANPIYQTESGEIYVISGQGFGFDTSDYTEGEIYSTTLRDEITVTKGGEKTADASSVTVRLRLVYEPVRITICQMDDQHSLLRSDEFSPGSVPTELTAENGAAYFLIETEKTGPDGSLSVEREIFEDRSESASFSTYYPLDNGLLAKQDTLVHWPDSSASPDPNPPV